MKRLVASLVLAVALLAPAPAASAAGSAPVDLRFTTSPDPSAVGEDVVLTAFVTPRSGSAKPTGTVEFKDGPATLGSAPVDDNGVAMLETVFAAPGPHDLTAAYSGDEAHQAASTPNTHTVDVAVTRKRWVGPVGGAWSNPAHWDPAGPPAEGDTAVLDSPTSSMGDSVLDIPALSLDHVSVVGGGHRVRAASNVSALGLTGSVQDDSTGGATLSTPLALASGDHVMDGRILLFGPVSGAGGITKTGLGTLTLFGANSYGGPTAAKAGVTTAATPGALGDPGSGTSVAAGATLQLFSGSGEPLTLAGDGASDAAGALHFIGSTTHTGPVSLQGERVTVSSVARGVLHGVVSGPAGLRKTGTGTLVVGKPEGFHENTYEGGTDVAAGTLKTDAFMRSLGEAPVDVRTGATLDVGQGLPMYNEVRFAADSFATTTEFSSIRGPVVLGGPLTVRVPQVPGVPTSLHFSGPVSGTGPIRKEGVGSFWLTNRTSTANTMTGVATVAEGTLLAAGAPGIVTVPDGVVVERGAGLTVFSDDQFGDSASLTVHGHAAYTGTGDRFGSLTVTGSLFAVGHYWRDQDRPDFGVIHTDTLHLAPTSTVVLAVEGSLPASFGETHDALRAATVSVGGRLRMYGHVPWDTTITVIDNTGTAPVSGRFDGAPEGAQLPGSPRPTYISYRGGDGNDVTLTTPPPRSGYWMLGSDGAVYPFGQAGHFGSALGRLGGATAVDLEPTTTHNGYWILLSDGRVLAFGDAVDRGSATSRLAAGERATSISNNTGNHYWVFTDRGRALPFDDARFYGDMSGTTLNGPVLGSVGTPGGMGYYMVASDGGIFAFGDAAFRGSMGGKALNGPVVGLAPDPDHVGYWLVATDGGIFAFDAPFRGSMGGRALNRPVVGMVAYGDGYLMVGTDGGIFNFSSKPFHGSLGSSPPAFPVTSVAPLNEG